LRRPSRHTDPDPGPRGRDRAGHRDCSDRRAEGRQAGRRTGLAELAPQDIETEAAYLHQHLARQVFDAFGLRIEFDKAQRRIEISATITEAVAEAFENTKALQSEGFQVTVTGIAGAGFEPATFGL